MTAIKHTLQREVFLPSEERLISVVHVTKEGKKKKACFLCAAGHVMLSVFITWLVSNACRQVMLCSRTQQIKPHLFAFSVYFVCIILSQC